VTVRTRAIATPGITVAIVCFVCFLMAFTSGFAEPEAALTFVESHEHEVLNRNNTDSAVAVAPDGKNVYVTRDMEDAVLAYRRDLTSGKLALVGTTHLDAFQNPQAIAVSPDNGQVYVASSSRHAIAVFDRKAADGQLSVRQVVRDGQNGVLGLQQPAGLAISPDGRHLYATGARAFTVVVFARDADSGELSFVDVLQDREAGRALPGTQDTVINERMDSGTLVDGISSPRGLTVTADGRQVLVAGYMDNALAVFARDNRTGRLKADQVLQEGEDGVRGLIFACAVAASPDGRSVYVASISDAVAVFRRDPETCRLAFQQMFHDGREGVDGLAYARSVAVSPDGRHVYVAGGVDRAIAVFDRNPTNGELTFVAPIRCNAGDNRPNGPTKIAITPDGAHVYAAWRDLSVVVFAARQANAGVKAP
jgi:6-phosphogluconolactonase (cycloisomerase 2 family)